MRGCDLNGQVNNRFAFCWHALLARSLPLCYICDDDDDVVEERESEKNKEELCVCGVVPIHPFLIPSHFHIQTVK